MNLVEELRRAYNHGEETDTIVVQMVLFGIRHADRIEHHEYSVDKLIETAGLPNHGPMIRIGMNISEHVELR